MRATTCNYVTYVSGVAVSVAIALSGVVVVVAEASGVAPSDDHVVDVHESVYADTMVMLQ